MKGIKKCKVKLNLLIVEDSISYAVELEQLASEVGFNVVATVDNSADALDTIFSTELDIILMDINIKGRLSGIDIAKRIEHLKIPVLYITSFGDEATYKRALNSRLIGYIVKPVDRLTLATSLKLLIRSAIFESPMTDKPTLLEKEEDQYIFFMKNGTYNKINLNDIAYINSDDNYSCFTLSDNTKYLLRISLNEVENLLLGRKFIRCHRQYIINQMKIKSINTEMNSINVIDTNIPYSRSNKQKILSIGIFLR